jgi:hypothetical protein
VTTLWVLEAAPLSCANGPGACSGLGVRLEEGGRRLWSYQSFLFSWGQAVCKCLKQGGVGYTGTGPYRSPGEGRDLELAGSNGRPVGGGEGWEWGCHLPEAGL